MNKTLIRKWEIAGAAFIMVFGSLLHFIFGWTGNWIPIAWFAPVNESVWEHFKLTVMPALLLLVVEFFVFGKSTGNFWFGKGLELLFMPLFVGLVFYGSVALMGEHLLAIDLASFYLSVALGQWISYKFLTMKSLGRVPQWFGAAIVLIIFTIFVLVSYQTPHIFIFEDGNTHMYGIPGR